ncbi:MAG TPA: hypothetical protein ENI76_03880 [Ignavibacteria bacterium]|nr:hypothetical protein [Ignavibacteria bacterium]
MSHKNRFKRIAGTAGTFGASRAIEKGAERVGTMVAGRAITNAPRSTSSSLRSVSPLSKGGARGLLVSPNRGVQGIEARKIMSRGIQKGVAIRTAGRGISAATRLGGLATLPVQAGIELSLYGKFLKQKAVDADIGARSSQALAAGAVNKRKRRR